MYRMSVQSSKVVILGGSLLICNDSGRMKNRWIPGFRIALNIKKFVT